MESNKVIESSIHSNLLTTPTPVHPNYWASAILLGNARLLTNSKRKANRERGDDRFLVDVMGAFGEFWFYCFCLRTFPNLAHSQNKKALFNPDGGSSAIGADSNIITENQNILIDIKTQDLDPKKKLFAINAEKHAKLNQKCHYYFAVIAQPYGNYTITSQLIPYTNISKWEERKLNAGYGDPSRNLSLRTFFKEYSRTPYPTKENEIKMAPKYSSEVLKKQVEEMKPRLYNHLPELKKFAASNPEINNIDAFLNIDRNI